MARPFDLLLFEIRTVYENHQELVVLRRFAKMSQFMRSSQINCIAGRDWHAKRMKFLKRNIGHCVRLLWQQELKRIGAKPINIQRSGKIF